jgi:hypothetical protein
MPTSRSASHKFIQTVPVRTTVEVFRIEPPRPVLTEDGTLVKVRGIVDLNPNLAEKTLPFWFDATVEIYDDHSAEVISFKPAFGSINGGARLEKMLVYIYENAFARSLVDTRLKIIGVR